MQVQARRLCRIDVTSFAKQYFLILSLLQQMSQFQKFTIATKIEQTQLHIKNLKESLQKIKENEKQLQVSSIERVNKVALFSVLLTKTSEITIKMNKQYFAKVKASTAISIISARIQHYQQQIKKWEKLKENLTSKTIFRQTQFSKQGGQRSGLIEPIGLNEEGEEIFNIVQFGDNQRTSLPKREEHNQAKLNIIPELVQEEQSLKSQTSTSQKKQSIKQSEQAEQITQKKVSPLKEIITVEKPKKMSKFKAQRAQMKDK